MKNTKKTFTQVDAFQKVRGSWNGIARPVTQIKGDDKKKADKGKCRGRVGTE